MPPSRLRHSSGLDPRGSDESLAERPPQPAPLALVHGGPAVDGRHLRPFVDWLNRNRLPGEKPDKLVPGP